MTKVSDLAAATQEPIPPKTWPFWTGFGTTATLLFMLVTYSPGQDHIASISLGGDGSWFLNYEQEEIQDPEILSHGIGHSIQNAQQADILFLGSSRLIFGIDWQIFEDFEQKHNVKMFNLSLAGNGWNGEIFLRIIRKYNLHPKMWIINADRDHPDPLNSFFFIEYSPDPPFRNWKYPDSSGTAETAKVITSSWFKAFKTVLERNIRWRLKMVAGSLKAKSYRSAKTGNWYLDTWPNYTSEKNAPLVSRVTLPCPAFPQEVDDAKSYVKAIGGTVVLIQTPSDRACAQRVHELASVLSVPSLTVDSLQFTGVDAGHLDKNGARKYSRMFFGWLEQLPEFRRLFSK